METLKNKEDKQKICHALIYFIHCITNILFTNISFEVVMI